MSASKNKGRRIPAGEVAADAAGGPAPPQAAAHGFDALVGQDAVVAALRHALEAGRLPHAMLFQGPVGVGKATCAGILASALNCREEGPADACGRCVSCRKVARGLHPDISWVQPEKRIIRVEQARDIVESVGYRPYEGNRRVVVIDDAHTMNANAQNALLKTLEEPPPSSVMVLVTPAPRSLLPTVRSRCQLLRFRPLPMPELRRQLEGVFGMPADEARLRAGLAPGSLGRAIDLDFEAYTDRRDVAESALKDARDGGASLLAAAETLLAAGGGERKIDQATSAMAVARDILRDLLVLRTGSADELLVNADRAGEWRGWATATPEEGIVAALAAIERADERLRGPLQPNVRLTIERALVEAGAALRGASSAA